MCVLCVCVYTMKTNLCTLSQSTAVGVCFFYVFQEKGNTVFTGMQGEVFSLNLVLKYLGLSYLHVQSTKLDHSEPAMRSRLNACINKSACVDKREDRA